MNFKTWTTIGISFTFAGLFSIPVSAHEEGQDACIDAINHALEELRAFPNGEVPSDVGAQQFVGIVASCSSEAPIPQPLLPRADLLPGLEAPDACSGGGATVTGWANYLDIGGQSFHLLNGPASSHWTLTFLDDELFTENGYTRSALDDIVGANTPATNNFQEYYWSFADVPMSGTLDITFACLLEVLTSTQITAAGVPLGIGIGAAIPYVGVRSSGTTCIVPC